MDYHRLLDEARPELVTVAVPTEFHHQVALDALEAGCHVLVEKPIAATEEQAQALIERAGALGRKLMVGHIVRFDPAVQELKKRLEVGELGRIFQIRCRRLGPFIYTFFWCTDKGMSIHIRRSRHWVRRY